RPCDFPGCAVSADPYVSCCPPAPVFSSDNEGATVWLSLAWTFTARLRRLLRLRVNRVGGLGGSSCDAIGLQRLRQGLRKTTTASWKPTANRQGGSEVCLSEKPLR